jgi:cytochrome c-type biogenesis protein
MSDVTLATNLTFALTAGVATFFSPCAYPLLPGYVGYYLNQTEANEATLGGAGVRGIVAGVGVLATFAALMGATLYVGQDVVANITFFETLVGLLLVFFGAFVVTGYAPSLTVSLPKRRDGVLGFGLFGAGYALAGAGCVAPIFIGVIARAISLPAEVATLVLVTYAVTVAVLMVSVTVATGMGLLQNASRLTAYSGLLKRVAGIVMILAGLGQLYLSLVVY